ncbi:hypothetical protein CS542_04410, partial [Pedobacter sp. IW39]
RCGKGIPDHSNKLNTINGTQTQCSIIGILDDFLSRYQTEYPLLRPIFPPGFLLLHSMLKSDRIIYRFGNNIY